MDLKLRTTVTFRCDLSPSNCLVCRKKAFTEKFGDNSSVLLCQLCQSFQRCGCNFLLHAFSVRTFKERKLCRHTVVSTLCHFLYTPIPCQCSFFWSIYQQVGINFSEGHMFGESLQCTSTKYAIWVQSLRLAFGKEWKWRKVKLVTRPAMMLQSWMTSV